MCFLLNIIEIYLKKEGAGFKSLLKSDNIILSVFVKKTIKDSTTLLTLVHRAHMIHIAATVENDWQEQKQEPEYDQEKYQDIEQEQKQHTEQEHE